MYSRQIFEVPTHDDVERERVRGVFAIAAIAVLYYIRQMNGNTPIVLIPSVPTYSFGPITTDGLMTLWAFYVVTMAMTLSTGRFNTYSLSTRIIRPILWVFYAAARATYIAGVVFLLATMVYRVGLAFWESPALLVLFALLVILIAQDSRRNSSVRQQRITSTAP